MATAYCVKCRDKREIKDPVETKLKNGRPAIKGTCPECGTNVFRIGKNPDA
jgi:NAD-dependent SIR2 family protein deacetylase